MKCFITLGLLFLHMMQQMFHADKIPKDLQNKNNFSSASKQILFNLGNR